MGSTGGGKGTRQLQFFSTVLGNNLNVNNLVPTRGTEPGANSARTFFAAFNLLLLKCGPGII
jgi:hypothetical protein